MTYAESEKALPKKPGRKTKRPEYDLSPTRGDKLVLEPLLPPDTPHQEYEDTPTDFTILDMFCGAGGMSLGFEDAGFQVKLAIDADKWACQTFAANTPARVVQCDLKSVEDFAAFFAGHRVTRVDGIIGGPPCQGFSRVGRGKIRNLANDELAERNDPRNQLYTKFVAAVSALRPRFFVMENVPDLENYEDADGRLADRIQQDFEELGYVVDRRILKAVDFGVPQTRARLFFVGLHSSLGKTFAWPDAQAAHTLYGTQTMQDAIGDLPPIADGQLERSMAYTSTGDRWLRRWYRKNVPAGAEAVIHDHITRPHRVDDKKIFQDLEPGNRFVDVPEEEQRYRSDIFLDKYRKLKWDAPSWTVTAHIRRDSYRYIHPQQTPPRTISLREAARIQTFPDRWRFAGYRSNGFAQVGNAVPPLLARALGRAIKAQLMDEQVESDPLVREP